MASTEAELQSLRRVQDRLQSTRSEDLQPLLSALLPKLIPLTNQELLRPATLSVLSDCMKRIKLSRCPLKLAPLAALVRPAPAFMPFAANMAVAFLDASIDQSVDSDDKGEFARELLASLDAFDAFTPQSNALCGYLLHVLGALPEALHSSCNPSNPSGGKPALSAGVRHLVGDFLLDVALVLKPIHAESAPTAQTQTSPSTAAQSTATPGQGLVGSVHPGLSSLRVARLTAKRKHWDVAFLRLIKMQLVSLIAATGALSAPHAVSLAAILAKDPDDAVAREAGFKVNGVASVWELDLHPEQAQLVCGALLTLCGAPAPPTPLVSQQYRSAARAEVRVSVLRWLHRHLPRHIGACAKPLLSAVFKSISPQAESALAGVGVTGGASAVGAGASPEEVVVLEAALQLVELLVVQLQDQQLSTLAVVITQSVKKVLLTFVYSSEGPDSRASTASQQSGLAEVGDVYAALRRACYRLVEGVARRFAGCCAHVHRLETDRLALEQEAQAEEAREQELENGENGEAQAGTTVTVKISAQGSAQMRAVPLDIKAGITARTLYSRVTVSDADMLMLLFRLLDREHSSTSTEASVIAIHSALQALREAHQVHQMQSAHTPTEARDGAALERIRILLCAVRCSTRDSKMRLAALQWARALFGWQKAALETVLLLADDSKEAVRVAALAEFRKLRTHLAAREADSSLLCTLLQLTVEMDLVGGAGAAEGTEQLLGCVALALQAPHRLDADLQGLLTASLKKVSALEVGRPGTRSGDLDERVGWYFESREAHAQLSAPSREDTGAALSSSGERGNSGERGSSGGSALAALKGQMQVHEQLDVPLVRVAAAVVANALRLATAPPALPTQPDASVGEIVGGGFAADLRREARRHLPAYLQWLDAPEKDVRRDVGAVLALALLGSKGDGGGISVGGASAVEDLPDLNAVSSLSRLLILKMRSNTLLTPLHAESSTASTTSVSLATSATSVSASADSDAGGVGFGAIGALSALGDLLIALVGWTLENAAGSTEERAGAVRAVLGEIKRTHSAVLEAVLCGLACTSVVAPAPAPAPGTVRREDPALERALLGVVSVEQVLALARRGMLDGRALWGKQPQEGAAGGDSEALANTAARVRSLIAPSYPEDLYPTLVRIACGSDTNYRLRALAVETCSLAVSCSAPIEMVADLWRCLARSCPRAASHEIRMAWASALVRISALQQGVLGGATGSTGSNYGVSDLIDGASPLACLKEMVSRASTAVAADPSITTVSAAGTPFAPAPASVPAPSPAPVPASASLDPGPVCDGDVDVRCLAAVLLVLVSSRVPSVQLSVRWMLDTLLVFLRSKDPFLQDVGCMGLSHLYHASTHYAGTMTDAGGRPVTVPEFVTYEVMTVLMREKRGVQPAGFAVGASAPSSTSAPASNSGPANGTADTTAGVAGGGGRQPDQDPLLQAAQAAAAELGVGLSFNLGEGSSGAEALLPQDYVMYSALCRLAKTVGEPPLLFAALGLLRRDPTFGTTGGGVSPSAGSAALVRAKYAPPLVSLGLRESPARLGRLLPSLYLATFDPHQSVRPVMRALWGQLLLGRGPGGAPSANPTSVSTSASATASTSNIADTDAGADAGAAAAASGRLDRPVAHVPELDLAQTRVVALCCLRLQSKQWRERESACAALEALLPRCTWGVSVFPHLERLLLDGLCVLDDARDSTRTAALNCFKALSAHIVRACNPAEAESGAGSGLGANRAAFTGGAAGGAGGGAASWERARAAVDMVLPLLLNKGLLASSAEARGVSLGLIGKVVEAASGTAHVTPAHALAGAAAVTRAAQAFAGLGVGPTDGSAAAAAAAAAATAATAMADGVGGPAAAFLAAMVPNLVPSTAPPVARRTSVALSASYGPPPLARWLPQLVSALVEGMSAMEPRTLQYMQFHTARLRISPEELEGMRIKLAQASPLQEALDTCLACLGALLDQTAPTPAPAPALAPAPAASAASVLPAVLRELSFQLTRGVGLATRVGAAQAVGQLVERYGVYLAQWGSAAAVAVTAAFRGTIAGLAAGPGMAQSLRKAMTSALGALTKIVDADVLSSECDMLLQRYAVLELDQLEHSALLAQCIQMLVQKGGSRMDEDASYGASSSHGASKCSQGSLWRRVLCFALLGSHDCDDESRALWTTTLQDALTSSGAGTKLGALVRMGGGSGGILPEVLDLILATLLQRSWRRRVQAVQVLREVVELLPADTLAPLVGPGGACSQRMGLLLRALLQSLPGPVWGGQGCVLEVVGQVLSKCLAHLDLHRTASSTDATSAGVLWIDWGQVEVAGGAEGAEANLSLGLGELVSLPHTSFLLKSAGLPPVTAPTVPVCDVAVGLGWSVSFFGWAVLLVHESRRRRRGTGASIPAGDSSAEGGSSSRSGGLGAGAGEDASGEEYRLAAARALSLLPWRLLANPTTPATAPTTATTGSPLRTFEMLLPLLCKQAGVAPYAKTWTGETEADTGAAGVGGGVGDVGRIRASKRALGLGSAAMFGSRYQAQPTARARTSVRRVDPAPSAQTEAQTEAEVEAERAEPMVVVQTAEGTDIAVAVAETGEDAGALSGEDLYEDYFVKPPPVYFVYYAESLLGGWPRAVVVQGRGLGQGLAKEGGAVQESASPPASTSASTGGLSAAAKHLLAWALGVMRSEVWSVRKAAVQLVGALCTASTAAATHDDEPTTTLSLLLTPAQLEQALGVLGAGMQEQKFTKVRVEALRSLQLLLSGANREALDLNESLKQMVRELIRTASADSHPNILEAVVKVQNAWLR
ncbi:hypothetical protein B484DRAFT_478556 [Ochromonadaceae sp. CCMP2298]|nr:hypothetical protein B484DRAFT_478556 [Ochromonadaceae sp. CCMP2298]